jgi:4-alpha-glucanotransferase
MHRSSGVVLPLFSIRTRRDWGIGQITDLPVCAAWIRRAGQRLLQVLPPHELSVGETSPYGALTAFGLDPIYLDVEAVPDLDSRARAEVLGREGDAVLARLRASSRVDYREVRALKTRVLRAAFDRFFESEWARRGPRAQKLSEFIAKEGVWLDDLALYTALREARGGSSWTTWSEDQRERRPSAMQKVRADHGRRIVEVAYIQWLLSEQWNAAHAQMRDLGVELMGDIPFIVGTESADVWSHAAQFQLNVSLGAPPDDYSAEGQDWGLPAYDWLAMEADNLGWIRARARRAAQLYDRFRLDHVVGYFRQWVRSKTGPGRGRFDPDGPDAQQARGLRVLGATLQATSEDPASVGPPRAIAEDLGVIPPFVHDVLRRLEMPGYRVLPWQKDRSLFRDPRAFPASSVASWSTHDTAPIDAWWDEFPEDERLQLSARARIPAGASPEARSLALLGDLFQTSSDLTLVLAQELLGSRERINVPGTVGSHNWTWRLPAPIEDLQADRRVDARLDAIRVLVDASGRSSSR